MHANAKDVTGQKFEKLTVIGYVGSRTRSSIWKCKCDCGNETEVKARDLPRTKSCGRCRAVAVDLPAAELAWSAGFFDGEGHVGVRYKKRPGNNHPWFMLSVVVTNTHLGSLERLKNLFGFGTIHKKKLIDGRRQTYVWILSDRQAEMFLLSVQPYSVVKSEHIKAALEYRLLGQRKPYQLVPRENYERMKELADTIRKLNGNNHRKSSFKRVPDGNVAA